MTENNGTASVAVALVAVRQSADDERQQNNLTPPFPTKNQHNCNNSRKIPNNSDECVPMIRPQSEPADVEATATTAADATDNAEIIQHRRRLSNNIKRLTRAIIVLAVVLAFFVVVAVVFVVLFAVNQKLFPRLSATGDDSNSSDVDATIEDRNGCKSDLDCLVSLGPLMQSVNKSVDPCEDFYAYACGRFVEQSQLENSESSRSAWDLNSQAIDKTLEAVLNLNRNESDIVGITERKAFRFFKSCLDTAKLNERGRQEATKLLRSIGKGDWYMVGLKNRGVLEGGVFSPPWNLEDSIVQLITRASFTVGVLGLVIHQDQRNVSRNVVTIDAPNLTLGGRQLYMSNASNAQLMTAYFNYVYKLANFFAQPDKKYKINNASVWGIINFERKIAEIVPPAAVYEHVAENYRVLTIPELQNECPIADWTRIFRRVMTTIGYYDKYPNLSELTEVAIFGDYLPKLSRLISSHVALTNGAMHIHNYMAFVGLHAHADDLGETISFFNTEFENILSGVTTPVPLEESEEPAEVTTETGLAHDDLSDRQDICRVKTKNIFGLPLSKYYIEKHFNAEAKKVATNLVEDIKVGFLDELEDPQSVDWMDDVTKKEAKQKANKMVLNVGYPDILTNEAELDALYGDFNVTHDYVENVFNNYRYSLRKAFSELNNAPDRSKWEMDPIESNAYYTTSANKIVIPAAILQVPFFNPIWIDAINYGAIGTVIGHEITHGFDVAGSQFDAAGQIVDWWDVSTRHHFTERTKCISEQYSSYEVINGLSIDGEMTLSENIADNGGLTAAYRAFRKKVGSKAKEKSLSAFDLTDEQVFFLSFAQVWCQNIRPEQLANDVETDTHSPNRFRVIGALSNSADFSRAYSCPTGSFMNPKKKCKVW